MRRLVSEVSIKDQLESWPGTAIKCSIQRLCPLIENLEIFLIRVNAAVIVPGGFAGDAEFGQVFGQVLVPAERNKG